MQWAWTISAFFFPVSVLVREGVYIDKYLVYLLVAWVTVVKIFYLNPKVYKKENHDNCGGFGCKKFLKRSIAVKSTY